MIRFFHLFFYLASTIVMAAGSGGINSPENREKPYLILVSLDGFRWDYQDRYETPTLDRIAAKGVRAARMIPVFPTLTFPNHYTIATGLYPANHGLISNTFPNKEQSKWYRMQSHDAVQNGEWYSGEPVWIAAEKAGMVTAAYYFVGTEANIQNIRMSYWNEFNPSIPGMDRVNQVFEWLAMPEEKRPHFITLYFEDVDTAAHQFGADSKQSISSIKRVDGYLKRLLDGLEELPIADRLYLLVVSDHGLLDPLPNKIPFIIDNEVSLEGLNVIDSGSSVSIYFPKNDAQRTIEIRDAINNAWSNGKAMLSSETPENWQATTSAGFADLIIQANPGYLVFSATDRLPPNLRGHHGWAPEEEAMHAIFLASGPRLPKGMRIEAIRAIDVYPLMMEILGLPITSPIDGDSDKLVPLLQ